MQAVADDKADALEEARLAVEEIVIPRQQIIELLPRSPSVLELQVASALRADDLYWPFKSLQSLSSPIQFIFTCMCVSININAVHSAVQVNMLHGYDVGVEVMGSKVNSSARLRIMPSTADAH